MHGEQERARVRERVCETESAPDIARVRARWRALAVVVVVGINVDAHR